MILIVVKHPVRPAYADEWPTVVEEFTAAARAEPGNVCFDWYRSSDDPNQWLVVEAFRNAEAGRAHVRSVPKRAASTRGLLLVVDDVEVVERRRAVGEAHQFLG